MTRSRTGTLPLTVLAIAAVGLLLAACGSSGSERTTTPAGATTDTTNHGEMNHGEMNHDEMNHDEINHGDMGAGRTAAAGVGDAATGDALRHTHDAEFPTLAQRLATATPSERAAATDLLARIDVALARYADESVARSDGFVPNPNAGRLIHYRNVAHRRDDHELDPTHLEGLVYARTRTGRLVLLGALFTVRPGEAAPTPAGDIFRWHTHDPSCAHFLVGPGECADTFRMLHVWATDVVPVLDPWQQHFRDALGRA